MVSVRFEHGHTCRSVDRLFRESRSALWVPLRQILRGLQKQANQKKLQEQTGRQIQYDRQTSLREIQKHSNAHGRFLRKTNSGVVETTITDNINPSQDFKH